MQREHAQLSPIYDMILMFVNYIINSK